MKERNKLLDIFAIYRYVSKYTFFEYVNIVVLAVINYAEGVRNILLFSKSVFQNRELQNPVRCHSYLMLTSV